MCLEGQFWLGQVAGGADRGFLVSMLRMGYRANPQRSGVPGGEGSLRLRWL